MAELQHAEDPLSTRRLMLRFLLAQRWRIVGAVAAGAMTIIASVCLLAISAYLIERASERPPILSLEIAIVSVRFFGISRGVFRYLDRLLSHDASFRLLGDIRADVYRTLIPLAPAGLQDAGRGELLQRVVADVDTLQEWFVRGISPICAGSLAAVIIVVSSLFILPAAGLALSCVLLVAAAVTVATTRTGGIVARSEMRLQGAVTEGTVNYVQGIADLVAMGSAATMAAQIETHDRARTRFWARRAGRNGIAAAIQTSLPGVAAVVLTGVGIASLAAGLNPLQIGVLCLGGMAAAECVAGVPDAVGAWERGHVAARRLAALRELPPPVGSRGSRTLGRPAQRLDVVGVSFRYRDRTPYVLDAVSLDVRVGEAVVIVGRSGAGKTTLANLLLRFSSPESGSIRFDDVDLAFLSEHDVRQQICAATQDAHLFAGTIRQNILLARPESSDEAIRTAAEGAQLTEWIDTLPAGWETDVGDLGGEVSGGQRRRIALARALLTCCPFLVADEPTEGLDTPTARAVMNTLFSAAGERGLVLITHRLDLCPRADRVYRLAEGRLTPLPVPWARQPAFDNAG